MSGDHVARYLAMVDAKLGELPEPQRAPFLEKQRDRWEELYRQFQIAVDCLHTTPKRVDAVDFIATIAGLDQRLAQYQESAA